MYDEPLVIEVERDEPAWLAPTLDRLAQLLRLPANWDSYGARPIAPRAAASALELLAGTMSDATPPPLTIPTNQGGIQLEWHTRGFDLEAKPLGDDRLYLYCEDHQTGEEWEGELSGDPARLRHYLAGLAHRS